MRFLPSAVASSIRFSVTLSETCATCFCPGKLLSTSFLSLGFATASHRPSNPLLSSMSAWTPSEPNFVNWSLTEPLVSVFLVAVGSSFGSEATLFALWLLSLSSLPSPFNTLSFNQSMKELTAASILPWIFSNASLTARAILSKLRSLASNLIPKVNVLARALSTKLMAFERFPWAIFASSLVKLVTRLIILVKFSLIKV